MNWFSKSGKNKLGFTLIEIMLALLVVSIGIVAMIGLLGTTLDRSYKAHSDIHAVSFADMVFNYCYSTTNWSEILTKGTLIVPDYNYTDASIQINQLAQFECKVSNFGNNTKPVYTVSYILDIAEQGKTIELSLKVWPGFSTNGSARIFYTELYNGVNEYK